jgi:SAM-dependent methyltransferase
MSLQSLVNNSKTDKNTTHSYLDLYERLLQKKKNSAKYVLEVGIGSFTDKNGGSIQLWRDYFPNATIYGLDILPLERVMDELKSDPRVVLYTQSDAYSVNFFRNNIGNKPFKFDFLLDDGPHTLESMKKFIQLYTRVMAHDGILIVEDVQSWDWIEHLKAVVPEPLKQYVKVYDLRANKGRYDDIVFTIDRS